MEFRNLVCKILIGLSITINSKHPVPQPYIALLRAGYSSQSGAVHGGRPCDIQRGVKQGDIHAFQCCSGVCLAEMEGKM